jgi:hypothetical protein
MKCFFSIDLNHTFEDQLEVLMERLKESQTIGTDCLLCLIDKLSFFFSLIEFQEPRSKHVANLKKQIAQVRRTITKNLSSSSINNDESILLRTTNDESSSQIRSIQNPFTHISLSSGNNFLLISQCIITKCHEKSIRTS